MIHVFDFRITLELGPHRRVVTLAALAQALGLAGHEAKLRSLLFAAACPEPVHNPFGEKKPTETMGLSSLEETKNGNDNNTIYSSFSFRRNREDEGSRGEEGGSGSEHLAVYLADRFDDWKSYRFFLLVASSVPREVIREALVRALDVPRRDVRRSRAAYFTALVRPHLARRAHARPSCT